MTEALDRLVGARSGGAQCAPVRDVVADLDAAYAVQAGWVGTRRAAGARVVGRKIGFTNPAARARLGADHPDFGVLLDEMARPTGGTIEAGLLRQPRVEVEIAFVLARDLAAVDDPRDAVGEVVAALEIVDSRIADWDITLVDTVADNASAALFVLGDAVDAGAVEPRDCATTLWHNGEVVAHGVGADSYGDPYLALGWLADAVRRHGEPVRAGDVVLTGALGLVVPALPGGEFRAVVAGVGEVSATFAR
ncbi:fumarylacetoacetate hydrolase family protein [Actinosynnema sp. NPDC020468]|uniref:2-keto-4-pentenoate hydratase n=1 Tax=Actinosynnema sp. NPDC020468 TaxID=3154488 RepID=UPI0033DAF475